DRGAHDPRRALRPDRPRRQLPSRRVRGGRRRRHRADAVRQSRRNRMVLMEAKLRVERASKIYAGKSGPVHALDDISLDVAEGALVTILGPSGCGKTTLLWAISGLHALTGGRITLDGTEGDRAPARDAGTLLPV